MPAIFVHFNFSFLGIAKKYSFFVFTTYFVSLLAFVLNLTPFFVRSTSPKFGLNFYTDPGALYLPFVIYFFVISLSAIFTLLRMREKVVTAQKKHVSLLFWSALLAYPLGGFNYNLSFGIGSAVLALIGNYAVVFYGITVAYAITKHRLLDISVIISRAAAKGVAAVFFIAVYLVIFWSYQTYAAHSPNYFFAGWNILYGILVFHTFNQLRFFIQTSSEKVFLRGKYNYYKELAIAVGRISRNLSRKEVLLTLRAVFYDVIEASNPRVYLPEDFNKPEVKELLLIKKMTFKEDDLVIPCLFDGKPMALIVLGPKFSEDVYSDEDLKLLTNLASQTAIALDHCRLCEEMLNAQKQLLMADKLSSLGRVAAGLAHEIKNPLTAIKGMTQGLSLPV